MSARARLLALAAIALSGTMLAGAVGTAVHASAARIGGVATTDLGAADAQVRSLSGVSVAWTTVAQGADWAVGGATVSSSAGQFSAGSTVRLALDFGGSPASCEAAQGVPSATASLVFAASAFSTCGTLLVSRIQRVAVLVSGVSAAATSAGSLGAVQAELTSVPGALPTAPATPPAPAVTTALQPVGLDSRLSYAMPSGETNSANSLAFCHTFTVTNASSSPVNWTATFDTSKPPLYGMDPTAAGALSSSWGFTTLSYSAATHLWTIGAQGQNNVLQPGQSVQGGYCAQNVPMPAIDPSLFTVTTSVEPGANANYVAIRIRVAAASQWAVPWQADVDLAQLVCGASLAGHPVSFSRVTATPRSGSTTAYRVIGTDGDTRLVSAAQTRDFVFASYSPNGGAWGLPCAS